MRSPSWNRGASRISRFQRSWALRSDFRTTESERARRRGGASEALPSDTHCTARVPTWRMKRLRRPGHGGWEAEGKQTGLPAAAGDPRLLFECRRVSALRCPRLDRHPTASPLTPPLDALSQVGPGGGGKALFGHHPPLDKPGMSNICPVGGALQRGKAPPSPDQERACARPSPVFLPATPL